MLTSLAGNIAVQSGEDKVTITELSGAALSQDQVAKVLRHRGCLLPAHSILVLLAGIAFRGTDGVQFEEGVISEEKNEALANGASGTEDTLSLLDCMPNIIPRTRGHTAFLLGGRGRHLELLEIDLRKERFLVYMISQWSWRRRELAIGSAEGQKG